ncbi:GNAT family N-acetyltransferase [Lysinibacillus capsici]|uniref:GNAT family N-acetyltransferase n=1 Tax=Lysinibacillus capsici TaxID=2115968 RepID=A0ABY8KG60_9BACI|nr:GNAT family N-acetyltransferase [Lysinibacillus capsici]MCR6523735.1 GNAT family N-acetyltransferase [Lysinibacillus capsici]MDP1395448.1 GNAT family N-acetyltransferase [Lysinibacillus capsici]MDP1415830.1 GNAT family N-acetyltransferase [Lysinibacillus capsici]MDP1431810.1 GNAT family N-acetyltransferase [Lysinibacillus capsici]WGF37398.1 GNAT family N-acetyltransferase [Lysinibacillus capsici]
MEIIYDGMLGETPFFVIKLTLQHLQQIEELQVEVYEALADQSILQPLSTEEFEYILNGHGMMIGAYVGEELIAFRALLNPPIDEEHLGYDCGIAENEFQRVLYQEISNVSPKYRGYGLQKTLATVVMENIDLEKYDYVCSTVKPYNIPSLKDKFSQDLVIKGLKIKYVDKLRYIFYKDLRQEMSPNFTEKQVISMGDTTAQQQLLKQGFLGTSMFEENNGWFVVYEK